MTQCNSNLTSARKAKNDEFYTRLTDIEKEVYPYRHIFKDKVVFCNCDDPRVSNFFIYFAHQFEFLGLKKLITTCYKSRNRDMFTAKDSEKAISLVYTGDKNGNHVPDVEEIGIHELEGDGDFRSPESIEMLKEADIVVTNPPFSLFREYVDQLIEYDKKFLIIGSMNAVTYKEVFPRIRDNKMWLGVNSVKEFVKPNGDTQKFGNILWFTNLEHNRRKEEMVLYRTYSPEEYPKYDNYDAIEVSKVNRIPCDYDGAMGVPITFLDKYNPNQFEILGTSDRGRCVSLKTRTYTAKDSPKYGILNACGVIKNNDDYTTKFTRIFIRRR